MRKDLQAWPLNCRELTADIVAAYVSNNHVQALELPALLTSVHTALQAVAQARPAAAGHARVEKAGAGEIRRSVVRDALISFEDGRPYKTLKRHLSGRGLTPEAYRTKWGLPVDYPMVASDYAERRSALAKAIGLGRPTSGGAALSLTGWPIRPGVGYPEGRSSGAPGRGPECGRPIGAARPDRTCPGRRDERSMPPPIVTCRSCGRTIPAGTTHCIACATDQADRDAGFFDRWLAISLGGSTVIAIAWAGYWVARYFSLLA